MKPLLVALVVCGTIGAAHAQVAQMSKDECAAWIDHLIPLPHEIAIAQKALVRPQDVGVKLRADAGEVEQQALSELLALFKDKAGVEPKGAGFEIHVGVLDDRGQLNGIAVPNAARLKSLPHSDQAYLIQPVGETQLLIAALNGKGVYYGVQTLMQLLAPKLTKGQVEVPLATVVDWPDMDERGLWNFDLDLIPWIASLKMNFAKVPAGVDRIERGKPVRAKPARTKRFPNVLVAGRVRALHAVPNVTHLNYIGAKHGAYKAYPELAGKGDEAVPTIWYKPRRIRVPCAACPALKKIIAEYMMSLASQGAVDISVWLSEFQGQCQCPTCLKAGQLRMETQAAVDGWRIARKQYPNLDMRIFYCFGGKSLEDTYNVLKELPPEVKIERCYGKYGEAFDKVAAEGRWIASYSGLPLYGATSFGMRFHGGSRILDYVRQLYDRKWDAVYSINYVYSTGEYQRGFWDYHVSALAEWTWNLNGRKVEDLARAWATRAGYARPDKVGAWVALVDPVERQLHYVLSTRDWGKLPDGIKEHKAFAPGRSPLTGFPSAKPVDKYIATCERAMAIAKDSGAQNLVLETEYVTALAHAFKGMSVLLAQASQGKRADAALGELRQASKDMVKAFDAIVDTVKANPPEFAVKAKKQHAEMWDKRVKGIEEAVAGLK